MDSRDSPGSAERSLSRNTSQMVNSQAPVHGVPRLLQIGLPIYQSFPVVQPYFLLDTVARSPMLLLRSQSPNIQQSIIPKLPQAAVISDQKSATNQFHSLSVLQHSQRNIGTKDINSDTANFLNTKINSKTVEGNIGQIDLMLDVKSEPQGIAGTHQNSLTQQVDLFSTKTVDQVNGVQQSIIQRLPLVADISKPKSFTNQCQSLTLSNNKHQLNTNTRDTISDSINLMNKTHKQPIECNTGQDGSMLAVKTEPQEIASTHQNSIPQQDVVSFSTGHNDQVNKVQQSIIQRHPVATDISKPKSATNQCPSISEFNNSPRNIEIKDNINLANEEIKPEPTESNIDQDSLMLAVKSEPQEIQKITNTNQNVIYQHVVGSFSTEIVEQMKDENVKTESTEMQIREPIETDVGVMSSGLEKRDISKTELINVTCGCTSNHDGETTIEDVELVNLGEITDQVKTEMIEAAGKQIDIGDIKFDKDPTAQRPNENNSYSITNRPEESIDKMTEDFKRRCLYKTHGTVTGSAGIHKPSSLNPRNILKSRDIQYGELATNYSNFAVHSSYININTKNQPYKNIIGKLYTETEKLGIEKNTELAKMLLPNIYAKQRKLLSQSNLSNLSLSGRYLNMDKEKKKHVLTTLLPPKANVNTQTRPLTETSNTTASNMPASCSARPISVPTQLTQSKLKIVAKSSLKEQPSTFDQPTRVKPMEYSDNLLSPIEDQPQIRNVLNSSTTPSDISLCSMITKIQQSKTSTTVIESQSKLITRATERQEEDGHNSSSISQIELRNSPLSIVNQKLNSPLQSCSGSSNNCLSAMNDKMPVSEVSKQMTGDPISLEMYRQCAHCNAVFDKSRELSRHISLKHELITPDKFYNCGLCKDKPHSYNSLIGLRDHLRFYHNFREMSSPKQKERKQLQRLKRKQAMRKELNKEHESKQPLSTDSLDSLLCSVCGQIMVSKRKRKFSPKCNCFHQCGICCEIFENKEEYRSHLKSHLSKKRFSCSLCRIVFSNKGSLQRHMKRHKNASSDILCPICGKFFSKFCFATHERAHKNLFQCTICGKHFSFITSYKNHLKTHSNERLLTCDLCGKQFITYYGLVMHIKRHLDNKLLKCDLCDVTFVLIGSLRLHLKSIRHRHLKTIKHLSKCHSSKMN